MGTFYSYSSGIFAGVDCDGLAINHGMVAIGYGVTDGQEYAIIRNSWGTWWGDEGHAKVAIASGETHGVCLMLTWVNYPIMA
jgi:hypothetical protein